MKKKAIALLIPLLFIVCIVPVNAREFSDVSSKHWFYSVVTDMSEQNLLSGYENGTFRPNQPISFAEFVSITARCVSLSGTDGQTNHWAADVMQTALASGWYDWDECPPTGERFNEPIARQVAIKILMKAFSPDARGDYNIWSAQISDFSQLDGRYYEPVFAAYELGLVFGSPTGEFQPKRGLSRAESCAIIARALAKFPQDGIESPAPNQPTVPVQPITGGVSENGWLTLKGTQLCNENGEPIVLHGMSSHGIQWFPQYTSKGAIQATADYGANLFRVAMYTAENGYISNPSAVKRTLYNAVDAAISLDMYVIIDWHILSDSNPNQYLNESKAFFKEVSEKYKDNPAVIYEICNEPNGGTNWDAIYQYASEVIPVIRANSPNSIILCGTPTWSQDVDVVAAKPLKFSNIMYTFHFYAGTHGQNLRDKVERALKAGTPIFVSEWGTCDASGNGGADFAASKVWIAFLNKHNLSWANWSLCDKQESASALVPGASSSGGWTEKDLTASGKFVFGEF